jgi:NAD+ diphosphatase
MYFVSSVTPPLEQSEPAWWFIFKNDDLLVQLHDDVTYIPCLPDLDQLYLKPIHIQYLGTLDGRHCYSAEIDDQDAITPDGMAFRKLRPLFETLPEGMFWIAARAFQIMHWDRTHQYCGRCGHPTQQLPRERAKVCPECGLTSYPRISPAIIVAVVKDRQLLLAHASRFPEGLYSVIAGFVEPGETFEECVRREVKEEVGIDVKDIQYFGSQPWPFPDSLMVAFTAHYAGGDIHVDGIEVTEAGWFTADNLPAIPGKISVARKLIDWFVKNYGNS